MTNIKISVIIPAYNRAKTIGYCLESVLNQTLSPLEVIVVDDCSTDDTFMIVRNYTNINVRCLVQEKNSGAQAARNRGIKEAKGDWIAFLDSDDKWEPNKLELQIAALALRNFDQQTVIHSNCWRYYSKENNKELWNLPIIEGDKPYSLLLRQSGPMFQGILTSKSALEQIGYLDEKVPSYQEWDTSIRLAQNCHFIHIQKPLFTYYLHEGETISKNFLQDIQGWLYILEKFRDKIIKHHGWCYYESMVIKTAFRGLDGGHNDFAVRAIRPIGMRSLIGICALLYTRGFVTRRQYNLSVRIINKFKRIVLRTQP